MPKKTEELVTVNEADTEKVSALKVPEKPLPPSSILTLSADL